MGARVVLAMVVVALCVSAGPNGAAQSTAAVPAMSGVSDGGAHRDCRGCHSGSGSASAAGEDGGKSGMPDASVCVSCHWDLIRRTEAISLASRGTDRVGSGHVTLTPVSGERVPPGGSETLTKLDCLSCHSPHPNGNPHQLRIADRGAEPDDAESVDPVSRSCLGCHGAFLQTRRHGSHYTLHPIGVAVQMSRKDDGGPELPLADGKLACTTCHLVHGSPNPDLLRWSRDEFASACTTCHAAGGGGWTSSPAMLAFGSPRR